MKKFKEILKTLDDISHLKGFNLFDESNNPIGSVLNKSGTQGSLRVYNFLWVNFNKINIEAAKKGIELFAEHAIDAKNNPGKHPNIDRLFQIIEYESVIQMKVIK